MLSRRKCLPMLGIPIGWYLLSRNLMVEASAATTVPIPDPRSFQSGDLVWPKKAGSFVPYDAGPPRDPSADESKWMAERDRFISEISAKAPYFTPQAADRLKQLTYREFYAEYAGSQKVNTPGVYSFGGGLYVGHVGIIEVDTAGKRWVIEALSDQGVVRTAYVDWIAGRPNEFVWLGRINAVPLSGRAKIPAEAKKYVGRPYDFWNFDLNDDQGFYCSKLVWMAIFRTQAIAIDGDTNPKRFFWFSPKQLLYVNDMARIFDPGPYATR